MLRKIVIALRGIPEEKEHFFKMASHFYKWCGAVLEDQFFYVN